MADPGMKTILVAEDDPFVAKALTRYATQRGFRVVHANNGLDAVSLGKSERPQVILLDVMLPGMDGRDVLVELTKAGVANDAVVIFASARDSQLDRLNGLSLGADDYETKPFHLKVLFNKIESLMLKKNVLCVTDHE